MSRTPAALAWAPPVSVALGYVAATVGNARELLRGQPPTPVGVVTSALYLAAWLVFAGVSGRGQGSAILRRTSVIWAGVVAGSALCGALLRQGATGTVAGGGVGMALLVVVAAPLYGLAGLLGTETAAALVGVSVGAAALTMGVALFARRLHRLRRVRLALDSDGSRRHTVARAGQSSAGIIPESGATFSVRR